MTFTWARKGGYEVSSKGDSRFSALYAVMSDGRTLECWYQCDIKGYDPGGTQWRLGKGKPPLIPTTPEKLYEGYKGLWKAWALANPHLMFELRCRALEHNGVLCDMFAVTPVNQAHALSDLLNEGY